MRLILIGQLGGDIAEEVLGDLEMKLPIACLITTLGKRRMSMQVRRRLLITLLVSVLAVALMGSPICAAKYNEAPMLAELVARGELPPVEERLPKNPVVVEPIGEIGKYGGTIRMGFAGRHYVYNSMLAGRFTDHEPFTWDKDATTLTPNWVESAEISEDGMVFTVKLREGVKWSDGVPLTVDDLLFNYIDIAQNPDITPSVPSWLQGVEFKKIDDYTLEFHLPNPAPMYIYAFQTSSPGISGQSIIPKHYMQQFHIDYADPDELERMMQEEGVDTWAQLFELKAANDNPDRPNLSMWRLVEATSERAVLERNPYYWKVDTAGNQLPYVDRVILEIVGSTEVVTMRTLAGQYDFTIFHLDLADYPTLVANEEAGGYRALLWKGAAVDCHLKFNLTYDEEDPVMAEILRTPEFRKALSYAIDREEINELVFLGTGRPVQISPPEGSPVYDESFPTMYATYDPQKANELLDSIGLTKPSGSQWRQRPDGKELRVELLASSDWGNHVKIGELIKDYWEAVGVRVDLQAVSFERRSQLEEAANYEVSMWKVDNIIYPTYLEVHRGFMTAVAEAPKTTAVLWWNWLERGEHVGIEPPQWFKDDVQLFEAILQTTDDAERTELTRQLWNRYYEDLWTIGIVQQVPSPVIISKRLKNVPDEATNIWAIRTPANTEVAQWYIDE
ncbi:MAG: ABC transporter substrate-binding protein [Firmicutes bacterium]|nr:ABC transporter substrate-binding protein [Bacillota bacterium]